MTYLFSQLCWWIIAALVIGLVTGWLTFSPPAKSWKLGWLTWALLVFIVGGVVAVLKWVLDTPGFWLEAALFLFAAYIIGCLLGSWIRALFGSGAKEVKPAATPIPVAASAPVAAVEPAPAVTYPGVKPASIAMPRGGADDLKMIKGIGPKNEKILNDLGVYRFCQIGAWTPDNANWVSHYISFPGRIEREQWVEQGKLLCAGIDTEYSRAVKAGSIVVDDKSDTALSDDDVTALKSQLPQFKAKVENEDTYSGARPLGLDKPIGGIGDDLKLIKGIGHQNEGLLHGLGIWHFHQIASWSEPNVEWVGSYLAFPGRIEREDWVEQAKVLARGGSTEFAERVKRGEVETSIDDGSHGQHNIERVDIDKK